MFVEQLLMSSFKSDEYQITSTFVEAAGKIVLTTIHHFSKANRDGYLNSGIKKGRMTALPRSLPQ